MNGSYGSLKEGQVDVEIETDKDLRKIKKKLRMQESKPRDDMNLEEIKKLNILINEYNTKTNATKTNATKTNATKTNAKPNKPKKANRKKESDDFLEKEYQKNKAKNAKKYKQAAEQKKREQKKREQEKREQEKRKEKEREEEERKEKEREEEEREPYEPDTDRVISNHGLDKKTLPHDILEIISDYSHKLWKKLSLKYHPDKYEGNDTYSKFLNCLKDDNQL